MPVTVAPVAQQDVPIFLHALGTVQASFTASVRSQIDGKLQSVNFVEGQAVHKGDTLAQIDPRARSRRRSIRRWPRRAQDEALLVAAHKDLARFQDLGRKAFETQQNIDQQQAKVDQLKASIDADQGAIESAQTQLSYATITAPIDGRVGFRQVDPGNVIHANDQNPLTVLTLIRPVTPIFTLPQENLTDVREAMLRGAVTVLAFDQNNAQQLAQGELLLVDNQIDQTTSTIRLKARFPNDDERLWPGEFVHLRINVDTRKAAVTIPPVALQRGPNGLYAWVIKPDGTAEQRPIEASPVNDDVTIVTKGLAAGEQVVVNGQYRLQPGSLVAARPLQASARRAARIMNISEPFIRRPIATSLLMAAVVLVGIAAFPLLPVAPLPQVDFPTIQVSAQLPGASPDTMAATVAAPLERRFGQIAGITQMTSTSTLGSTSITLQFDLNRNVDAAAQDVQAAITAAARQLPITLTAPPTYRKVNPADSPILILSAHSRHAAADGGRRLRRQRHRPADVADHRRVAGRHRRRAEAGGARPSRSGQAADPRADC